MLYGRSRETAHIEALLDGARTGRSGALAITGPPGVGKSALLEYAAERASGIRVLRCTGIQSETEIAYAALHAILRPALTYLDRVPAPQGDALRAAFGMARAPLVDPYMIGLATVSLLSEMAGEGPVVCLVDDAHWVDQASMSALTFAVRRFDAEGVVTLFAALDGFDAPGVRCDQLHGLDPPDARALLDEYAVGLAGPLRDRVLAAAGGNALALRELPALAALTPEWDTMPLPTRLQQAYFEQIIRLPRPAQSLLLVVAAEETGELGTVIRAAARFGAGPDAVDAAERANLIAVEHQTVRFRHPLIRAAAYQSATFADRRHAHVALAEVLTGEQDADRRAWHQATAALGPDERIAAELERTATRASRRHGHAAASRALERAATLTPDWHVRARRLIAAGESAALAGHLEMAIALVTQAARLTDEPHELARIARTRGRVANQQGQTREAYRLLTAAAEAIAQVDPAAAAHLLAETIIAVRHDIELTGNAFEQLQRLVSSHALERPDARADAAESADAAVSALRMQISAYEWALAAGDDHETTPQGLLDRASLALLTGDHRAAREHALMAANRCRSEGLIGLLPSIHAVLAASEIRLNRFRDATATAAEGLRLAIDTSQPMQGASMQGQLAWLAAIEGAEERCHRFATEASEVFAATDNPTGGTWAEYALAILDLGYGRHELALNRFDTTAATQGYSPIVLIHFAADHVEAAARAGAPKRAAQPLLRLNAWLEIASQQPGVRAIRHRCLALLATDEAAEDHYRAALNLHAASGHSFDCARTELLFSEWLRRARRVSEARPLLRSALVRFERAGAGPWAQRARTELRAAGETPSSPTAPSDVTKLLTPQELQVVRLAATGATNKDIATRLFLSPRTVGHHLYRAYPKLGVTTRTELAHLHLADRD